VGTLALAVLALALSAAPVAAQTVIRWADPASTSNRPINIIAD
jgi:hypothetical protein